MKIKLQFYLSLLVWILLILSACNSNPKDAPQKKLTMEKAWEGVAPDFRTGSISPDGKIFTDINWDTGNIEFINLETNEYTPLEGNGYDQGGYCWMSSFSNKGNQLVYAWYNYTTATHELRLYSMDTKEFKTLVPAEENILFIEPLDWTREDDKILVAKNYENGHWEFGFVSVATGSYQLIKKLNWMTPGGKSAHGYPYAVVSPDDRWIGFDYRDTLTGKSNLYILSIGDGNLSILRKEESEDRFLRWGTQGNQIYYYSDRNGTPSIWALELKDGKAIGDPSLIQENRPGLTAIGTTAKGFAIGYATGTFNTYQGKGDFEKGELLERPAMIDTLLFNRNNVGVWSKDGDSLLCVQFKGTPSGNESIIIKSIKDGGIREIDLPWDFHHKTGRVAWPTKNKILLDGVSPGVNGLHEFDLFTGKVRYPYDLDYVGFLRQFITNREGTLFYVETRGKNPGIIVLDPKDDSKTRLVEGQIVPGSTTISSDDKKLAYLLKDAKTKQIKLWVLDLTTLKTQEIQCPESGKLSNPLTWLPGQQKLIVGVTLEDERKGLWRFATNNPLQPTFTEVPEVLNTPFVMSPNTQNFAFQGGTRRGELFFINLE